MPKKESATLQHTESVNADNSVTSQMSIANIDNKYGLMSLTVESTPEGSDKILTTTAPASHDTYNGQSTNYNWAYFFARIVAPNFQDYLVKIGQTLSGFSVTFNHKGGTIAWKIADARNNIAASGTFII